MNHCVILILDSCRYDSVLGTWANLTCLPRLGTLAKAYSFSTWTLPSHMDLLAGRLPWKTSEHDMRFLRGGARLHFEKIGELRQWQQRLAIPEKTIISDEYSIHEILHRNGYRIKAITAAGPLGAGSLFSRLVDEHVDIGSKGDCLGRAAEHLLFAQPSFYIVNVCETHYPYWTPGYDASLESKILLGLRGLARHARSGIPAPEVVFSTPELEYLKQRQQQAVRHVDRMLPLFLKSLPGNCHLVITADHGEAFGEAGFVGHGEVSHPIVLEVPLIDVTPQAVAGALQS